MAWPHSTNCHAILPDIFEKLLADAISPDLGTGVGTANEGIVFGDRVVLAAFAVVNVDAQDLAEQGPEILAVLEGVVTGAAISVRDVEEAVPAEDDGSPVVVPVGLL